MKPPSQQILHSLTALEPQAPVETDAAQRIFADETEIQLQGYGQSLLMPKQGTGRDQQIEESALTGESEPVQKIAAPLAADRHPRHEAPSGGIQTLWTPWTGCSTMCRQSKTNGCRPSRPGLSSTQSSGWRNLSRHVCNGICSLSEFSMPSAVRYAYLRIWGNAV